MNTREFNNLVAHIENDPERRARVDALEQNAWDELIAHNLAELRLAREVTQAELAPAGSTLPNELSRQWRPTSTAYPPSDQLVEVLGGRLEVIAGMSVTTKGAFTKRRAAAAKRFRRRRKLNSLPDKNGSVPIPKDSEAGIYDEPFRVQRMRLVVCQ